jgi:hypothetical protein
LQAEADFDRRTAPRRPYHSTRTVPAPV